MGKSSYSQLGQLGLVTLNGNKTTINNDNNNNKSIFKKSATQSALKDSFFTNISYYDNKDFDNRYSKF